MTFAITLPVSLAPRVQAIFTQLGAPLPFHPQGTLVTRSPINGEAFGALQAHTVTDTQVAIGQAASAFAEWRSVPAPKRGELVRLLGEELRSHKAALGELVSIEAGKITQEGLGEVQEMIDICDFAVGLSRQLYGLTIASERPGHHLRETWHPIGVVGIISAFNFPVAVWAWNAALALVCGNSCGWKPSEKTLLTALATQALFERARTRFNNAGGAAPPGLSVVLLGAAEVGNALVEDTRVPLISATGSTRMGQIVGPKVAARFGKSLLELGGNNAMLVRPSADLSLALRAIVFSAVGTAGQRCTSLRRLIVHSAIYAELLPKLKQSYASLPIGDPLAPGTLVGPLIDLASAQAMAQALEQARAQGGTVFGGEVVASAGGCYVRPALVEMPTQSAVVCHETFAPILYVLKVDTLADAIALNNAVPQGLASSIFTTDLREAEQFVSATGSDCGIANINIGPSGAEIGGAFGGEKATGGGRESGSDAWRIYMRRATNTVNYSNALPLAQGIQFDL